MKSWSRKSDPLPMARLRRMTQTCRWSVRGASVLSSSKMSRAAVAEDGHEIKKILILLNNKQKEKKIFFYLEKKEKP
ncbi:MAG: hypothetical protein ACO4AJ_16140, partial [Prochlorothrix sp.]